VLASASRKFFCIGFDVPALLPLPRAEFAAFLRSFDDLCLRLIAFPKPWVAAVRGHAVAGGCILALCCDYRLIADGRSLMGLNEIKLGVPIPYPAECRLRQLLGWRVARDVVDSGDFFAPSELLRFGLVERILPEAQLEEEAVRHAASLGRSTGGVFSRMKKNRTEALVSEIGSRLAEKEEEFIDCWYSAPARARLEEAVEKFRPA
jgi:enoyl-CoA hydratase/carnithine racemase